MLRIENDLYSKNVISGRRKASVVHYHDTTYELYYLQSGTVTYLVDHKFYFMNPGDLIMIPPHISHGTDSENCLHNERLLLSFDTGYFEDDVKQHLDDLCQTTLISIPKKKLPKIEELYDKIGHEYEKDSPYSKYLMKLYISELILYLHQYKYAPSESPKHMNTVIQEVTKYIFEHYAEDLSLDVLSKEFNFSDCYLSRKFKSETGVSINQYINSVRISRARDLLKQPFSSITQVATLCGYNDSNYFAEVFKKMTGITPLKFSKEFVNK